MPAAGPGGVVREQRDAQPDRHRLFDRPVRSKRHGGPRHDAVLAQEGLDGRPRARAGLAQQPRLVGGIVHLVVGGRDHHQPVVDQRRAADAGSGRRLAADREVDLPPRQPLEHRCPVADLERDLDVRPLAAKGLDQRRHHVLSSRRHRRQAKRPHRADLTQGLVAQPQQLGGVAGQRLARRRQHHSATLAGDEVDPEVALQGADGGRHGRLGHHQRRGRSAHRAGSREGEKGVELAERHCIISLSIATDVCNCAMHALSAYAPSHDRPYPRSSPPASGSTARPTGARTSSRGPPTFSPPSG